MTQHTRDSVQKEFDPHYFADYALFSGSLRYYIANSLEHIYRSDPNDVHKRLFVISIYQAEYSAYEDLGTMLYALIRFKKGELSTPLRGILEQKPSNVFLETLLRNHDIKSSDDLYLALGLDASIPDDWPYPRIDLPKVMKRMCRFIFVDCQSNQKRFGVDAYNRIKHNLAFVPSGNRYLKGLPDTPAILITNPEPKTDPYVLLGIPMDDDKLEERLRSIEFVQSTLRAFACFYLVAHHKGFLKDVRKIDPPSKLFDLVPLIGVRDFMQQLSEKPERA